MHGPHQCSADEQDESNCYLLNLSRKFITLNLLNLLLLFITFIYYLFITKKFINFLAIPSKPSRLHSTFPLWRFAWGQP
jgi:hypothetical protein